MEGIYINHRLHSKSESVAIFVVCFFAVIILGGVFGYLANAFYPSNLIFFDSRLWLNSALWLVGYALLGGALFFAISADTSTKARFAIRIWVLALWALVFVLNIIIPFLIYNNLAYMFSFILLAITASICVAEMVLFIKIKIYGALLFFLYVALLVAMAAVLLISAI